jgi:hypothetical protein
MHFSCLPCMIHAVHFRDEALKYTYFLPCLLGLSFLLAYNRASVIFFVLLNQCIYILSTAQELMYSIQLHSLLIALDFPNSIIERDIVKQ